MWADSGAVTRIFSNLLTNALRHGTDTLSVKLYREGGWVVSAFSNRAEGLTAEDAAHVFERFYRVDKARSRETGGTGLGLAITRKVILMHHGAVRLVSKEGEGSTFIVRIPLSYISGSRQLPTP